MVKESYPEDNDAKDPEFGLFGGKTNSSSSPFSNPLLPACLKK